MTALPVYLHHDSDLPSSLYTGARLVLCQRSMMSYLVAEGVALTENALEVDPHADSSAIIERIAVSLDVAPTIFVHPDRLDDDKARILIENVEALKLFAGITDHDARQRGLAYLRWISDHAKTR